MMLLLQMGTKHEGGGKGVPVPVFPVPVFPRENLA